MNGSNKEQNEYWREYWVDKEWDGNHYAMNDYKPGRHLPPVDPETHRRRIVVPVLEVLDLKPEHHVLDVGCGSGLLLREIEARVEKAVGTDISQAMLDQFEGKSKTYCMPANELQFEEESFDRILMWTVSLYFPSFDYFCDVIERCMRLVKPGGFFLVGDVILNTNRQMNPKFMQYDPKDTLIFLDELDHPYTIVSHLSLRKRINMRKSIVIYKDYVPE